MSDADPNEQVEVAIKPESLPAQLRPLWSALGQARLKVFGAVSPDFYRANPDVWKLYKKALNKVHVADNLARACIDGVSWASDEAVAVRIRQALEKVEQFGRHIPGLEIPQRLQNLLVEDVFAVPEQLNLKAVPPRQKKRKGQG